MFPAQNLDESIMAKNILSPIATGNGAFVIHRILSKKIKSYRVCGYTPYWTMFPPVLPFLCRHKPVDLIHTTPDYAWFFRRKKTPLIITFHNYVLDAFMAGYSSAAQRLHYATDLKFFTRKALASADKVTSVSRFTAGLLRDDLGFSGDIQVIYNGIETSMFRPGKKKKNRKKVRVLFSGNLTRRKGADLLPHIASLLDSNIEILYPSGLRAKNRITPTPNLRPVGAIPYEDMPALYQQADILLFPTVREGLPLAVLEAMACGLPVVATDCSSLPELIIHEKGGYLCELGNVEEFATRINELAASPGLRREMGEFNRARVEKKFTVERMISEYNMLFEQVLDNNK